MNIRQTVHIPRRVLSLALCAAMVLTLLPLPIRAEGICAHHPEHTADCGYKAAVAGQDCAHSHDDSCGYQEASPCTHSHDDACGYREASNCTHQHTEECGGNGESCTHSHDEGCGYQEAENCTHSHDESCGYREARSCTHVHNDTCGYVEAVAGSPCTYQCEICAQQQNAQNLCTHGNAPDACEDCASDARVASVQKLIDALPETVTEENREAAQSALSAVDTAKSALAEAEQEKLTLTRYTALKALLAEQETPDTGKVLTDWEWVDDFELIDPETGLAHLPFASPERIAYFEDVAGLLPVAILADGEELTLGDWLCPDYPMESGAYEGEYVFTATLPEGYTLPDGTNVLRLTVVLGDPEGHDAAMYDSGHTHCICGATHQDIGDHTAAEALEWKPWGYWYVPGIDNPFPLESGNYYLTKDISLGTDGYFVIPAGWEINLCLNGHTLTTSGARFAIVSGSAKLCITDCVGGGKIRRGISDDESTRECIDIERGGTFKIFGGQLVDSPRIVENNGILRIYGGTLGGNKGSNTMGGGVWNRYTAYMYGGTIQGCTVTNGYGYGGGGVFNDGTFHMSGGSITNCSISKNRISDPLNSTGSGVYNTGTFNMSGGSITGNKAVTYNNPEKTDYYGYGFYNVGTLNISGNVNISGNTIGDTNGTPGNLLIKNGYPANITGNLDSNSRIYATHQSGYGTIAKGSPDYSVSAACFQPDDSTDRAAERRASGEVIFKNPNVTLTLDKTVVEVQKNGGSTATVTAYPSTGETVTWEKESMGTHKYNFVGGRNSNTVTITGYDGGTQKLYAVMSDGTRAECEVISYTAIPADMDNIFSTSTFAYDGTVKSPNLRYNSSDEWTVGGDRSATIPGTYYVNFTPKGLNRWPDGSKETKYVSWNITKGKKTPTVTSQAMPGDKLSTVNPPDGWSWANPDAVYQPNTKYLLKCADPYYEDVWVTIPCIRPTSISYEMDSSWRKVYDSGEKFSKKGLTVRVTFDNNQTREVDDYQILISGVDELKDGDILYAEPSWFSNNSSKALYFKYTVGTDSIQTTYDSNNLIKVNMSIPIPTANELYYTGQTQQGVDDFKDPTNAAREIYYFVKEDGFVKTATEVGKYKTKIGLSHRYDSEDSDYKYGFQKWSDGTIADKVIEWEIKKAKSTVTFIENLDKTYDGIAFSMDGKYTVTGEGAVTVEYKAKNAADTTYTTVAPTATGKYTVQVSVAETDHYKGASATKDFEIKGIPVTFSGTIQTNEKAYDGTNAATFNCGNVTLKGVAEGADVRLNAEGHFTDVNAGTSVPAVITGLSLTGTDVGKYDLQFDDLPTPAPAAITTKPISDSDITVTLVGDTPVYDGTEKTQSVAVTFGETPLVENTDYTLSGNTGTDAGSHTLTVTFKGNYSGSATKDWTITRAPITPVVTIANAVYGGTLNPSVSGNPGDGKVTYTYYSDAACTHAVTPKNVGTYYVKAAVAQTANYQGATTANAVSFQITQRPVTVSGINAENKTFDGNTDAELVCTNAEFDDKLEGNVLTVTGTGEFENANVGENKTVNITGLTLGGASKDNYTLAAEGQQTTTTATISVRSIDKPQENTTAFTYTGSEQTYTLTESEWYTITDNTRTDAGSQTVTVSLNDKQNTQWKDGTTDDLTFPFVIAKAASSVTEKPEDAKSLYSGVDVPLVTAGTAQGGTMMYRLGENGPWTETIPQAAAHGEYTVYYYVKGDGNHEDTAQQSLKARIRPFQIPLQPQRQDIDYGKDATLSVGLNTKVTEGITYQWCLVTVEDSKEIYTPLEGETSSELTLTKPNAGEYTYVCIVTCGDYSETSSKATVTVTPGEIPVAPGTDIDLRDFWLEGGEAPASDNQTSIPVRSPSSRLLTQYSTGTNTQGDEYPSGMKVYKLDENNKPVEIPDLSNLLRYSGCSIRITGKPGIRMITSLTKEAKEALKKGELAGYTLEEYGTVAIWKTNLKDQPLTLETEKANHKYAYKRGVSDPVFANVGNLTQYTNVLVWDTLDAEKYAEDIVMRPYIKLSKGGETVTLYGGTVSRSIGYVAQQNANTFAKGTAGYRFVHEIIDKVNALNSSTGTNTTTGGNG